MGKHVQSINGLYTVAKMYKNAQQIALATAYAKLTSAIATVCGKVRIVLYENVHLGGHILTKNIMTTTMITPNGVEFMHMLYVLVVDIAIVKMVHVNASKVTRGLSVNDQAVQHTIVM